MKNVKENLKAVATYSTADTTNAEGFAAWTPSDATLLEQLAMTGTLGNSFYANAREAAAEAVKLLERADARSLAAAIIRGRNEGFIRTFPILGLVYLSKKDSALFKETFNKVVLTGNDLVDFIEIAKTVRGFGRSLKAAMAGWIKSNANAYYAQKYRKQIADAIRLSRFKGEDAIYAYILSAYSEVKGNTDEKLEKAYEQYPDLAAHRDFVSAVESGDLAAAAALLKEKNIDVNSLTHLYDKFDKALWAAVAAKSPVMRFIKYLAKFLREGVVTDDVVKAKVNVQTLKKAKVFPFRLYTAYAALRQELDKIRPGRFGKDVANTPFAEAFSNEGKGVDEVVDGKFVLDYLADVLNDYAASYDWSAFADKKWVIAPDISGSMSSMIGNSSILSYAAVSAMFVGFFVKGLKRVKVLPWDEEVHPYTVPASDSVMTHIKAITDMVYGGTYMEVAVKHMLEKNIKADYAVFLTDTMEYGTGWLASWKDYHKHFPEAVAFVLRGDSYMTSPIPDDEAKKLNVYQIFGWNDSVIDYMKFVLERRKDPPA